MMAGTGIQSKSTLHMATLWHRNVNNLTRDRVRCYRANYTLCLIFFLLLSLPLSQSPMLSMISMSVWPMVASWRSTCPKVQRSWNLFLLMNLAILFHTGRRADKGEEDSGTACLLVVDEMVMGRSCELLGLCISMGLLFHLLQDDQRQGVRHRQWPTLVHRQGNQSPWFRVSV